MTRRGNPWAPREDGQDGQRDPDRAARELEDALYYLREGCQPCAQRHLTLARRLGATERQIAAVKLAGSSLPGLPQHRFEPSMSSQVITHQDAERDAAGAAARARVDVEALESVPDLRRVAELFSQIWAAPLPPMPHDVLRSLVHAGGRVHAAVRDGELLGAAAAVFGPPVGTLCYSLIAGVRPHAEGKGIGLALKLAQRAWAMQAGAARMSWTFDPLLRRNAWFNIARLGAQGTEYLVDFYGEVADGVNDPETDRLAVAWDLWAPLPSRAAPAGLAAAGEDVAHAILAAGPGGEPATGTVRRAGGTAPGRLRCWIPDDILTIRRTDPALARRWRLAVRESLGGAMVMGYQVSAVLDPGWYVLERAGAP